MARAYYGSRISENMTETPEGFLVCHNVPIARTGTQRYLGKDVGITGAESEKIVTVYRVPEEVFAERTLASFEGKVLTDDHPMGWVSPENANIHTRGVVTNVRRGNGADNDLLLADIIVYDRATIDKVRSKEHPKREVSCGYECEYENYKDGYKQIDIIGNHVSLVDKGRAGERVAIKDNSNTNENTTIKEGSTDRMIYNLPRKQKSSITEFLKAVGLKTVVQDSEPEDILDVVDELAEEKIVEKERMEEPVVETEMETDSDGGATAYEELAEKVNRALELINELIESEQAATTDEDEDEDYYEEEDLEMDALDALEEELEEGEGLDQGEEEESVTVEPEEITDDDPIYEGEKVLSTAYDSAIDLLRQFKPIIAAMPSGVERRKATDALIKQVKKVASATDNSYAKMSAPSLTKDASVENKAELGMEIAKKHNPHYKVNA